MAIKSDSYLLTRFEQGDVPDQQDFIDLINSKVNVAAGSGGEGKNYVSQANAETGSVDDFNSYNDSISKSFADTDINTGTDQITVTAHGFLYNDQVYITDALGTNIAINTRYYVIVVDANTISLSETLSGPVFDITGSPTPGTSAVVNTEPVNGVSGTTGIVLSTTPTDPIRGLVSYLYSVPATQQAGTGWSYDFEIENADRAKTLKFKFELSVVSGGDLVDGDIEAFIYDNTNNRLIPVTPSKIQAMVEGNDNQYSFYGTFQTNVDSLSYRMLIHWRKPEIAAHVIKLDSFSIGPQTVSSGVPSSDWMPYTIEIKGTSSDPTKGTVVYDKAYWRRVGDTVEITYEYYQSAGGSSGSGQYVFSLPPGLRIDLDKLTSNAASPGSQSLGFGVIDNFATNLHVNVVYDVTETFGGVGGGFRLFHNTGDSTQPVFVGSTAHDLGTATIQYGVKAFFPIKGWSSNVTMSSETDNRTLAFRTSIGVSGQLIPTSVDTKLTVWKTPEFDTHGAFDTDRWIAPISGYYFVKSQVRWDLDTTGAKWLNIYVDGVIKMGGVGRAITPSSSEPYHTEVSDLMYLRAGQVVEIYALNGSSGALTVVSDDAYDSFEIFKVSSGAATIMATEKIVAMYTTASGQTIPDAVDDIINFNTKEIDTHGIVTTGAGWKAVVPVSGIYEVKGLITFTNAVGRKEIKVYINGVLKKYLGSETNPSGVVACIVNGSALFNLEEGDEITIYGLQSSGAPLVLLADDSVNYVSISKI